MDAEKIVVGVSAPDFHLPSLSGDGVSLKEMSGAPLVIFFMRAFQ